MPTFNIAIGTDNSGVVCAPGNGHVRAHGRDLLVWNSNGPEFSLHFALIAGTGPASWPFEGPEQLVAGVANFRGTVAACKNPDDPPTYKYTVIIKGLPPLDPIIIVEK